MGEVIETQNNFFTRKLKIDFWKLIIWKTNLSFFEKKISMTGTNLVFYHPHKMLQLNMNH